jgi:serine/threonine protein kinase
MIGTTLSHYNIERLIGQGGMGVVYRAIDMRLGRAVAIKVIAAEPAGDPDRRGRFLKEARAASALNHLNTSPSTRWIMPTGSTSSSWSSSAAGRSPRRFRQTACWRADCRMRGDRRTHGSDCAELVRVTLGSSRLTGISERTH